MHDAAPENPGRDDAFVGEDREGSAQGEMSRRSVLRTTAGVAGAGLGLSALGGGTAAAAGPAAATESAVLADSAGSSAPPRKGRTMAG
ncbi:gfo/Idh/MocA family oxidoreductase, partial [Streptomyces sp. NPDC055039]